MTTIDIHSHQLHRFVVSNIGIADIGLIGKYMVHTSPCYHRMALVIYIESEYDGLRKFVVPEFCFMESFKQVLAYINPYLQDTVE